MFKAGFVNIVGNPNVGKSTLMNALVGERLSIITAKAQTTRHRIRGILSGEDFQIVFSDTPGVLKPGYKLQDAMLQFSVSALADADVLIYVTDTVETPDKHPDFLAKAAALNVPKLVIINKIDLSTPEALEALVERWELLWPGAVIAPISALERFGTAELLQKIIGLLPEGLAYFDKEVLTDKTTRFFASEIIREQIFENYDKEIPYSCEVGIEAYEEGPTMDRISAVIYVERQSQKGILIGHKGSMLKRVGTAARKDLESFLGKKVFLEIFVKVDEKWRHSDQKLRALGYVEQ